MKELFLGTTNPAKVHIVRASVASLPIEIVTPEDLGLQVDVKEDGRSTVENAERKARAYFAAARMPTLAIDGGLHIAGFAAEKQPGVFVRRIYDHDQDATDEEVLDYTTRGNWRMSGGKASTCSEMAWKERPDARWVFEFLKQHLDLL